MYFKVTDSQMRSIYYDNYHGKGIQYEIGKMVRPQVGKIFAYSLGHLNESGFMEFHSAYYRKYNKEKRLFVCQCLFPKHCITYVRRPVLLCEDEVGDFFTNRDFEWDYVCRNVVLSSGVKLVREIFEDEFLDLIKNRENLLQAWRTRKS